MSIHFIAKEFGATLCGLEDHKSLSVSVKRSFITCDDCNKELGLNINWDLVKKLSTEYRELVDKSLKLIYQYRNGKIPEKDCWITIRKRDDTKNELLHEILKGEKE